MDRILGIRPSVDTMDERPPRLPRSSTELLYSHHLALRSHLRFLKALVTQSLDKNGDSLYVECQVLTYQLMRQKVVDSPAFVRSPGGNLR
eukprot:g80158.t1